MFFMNRELSFKIWDNEKKRMSQKTHIAAPVVKWNDGDIDMPTLFGVARNERFTFLQYSNLDDKFGVKIYDGDILKLINDSGTEIKVTCKFGQYERVMDSGHKVIISGFAFINHYGKASFPIINNYAGKNDLEIMEIIGNIYENPELLK